MLEAQIQLNGEDCDLIFTTTGRMWRERNFYRDVWKPAQKASRLDIRPHERRHSYVTHLRGAGINDRRRPSRDRSRTMLARYTRPIGGSFGATRAAAGRVRLMSLTKEILFEILNLLLESLIRRSYAY